MCFSPQWRADFWRRKFKKWSEADVLWTFSLENMLLATAAQFFDIGTAKSSPTLSVFQHFHLQMCFSPQRRAIFRHRNFKKWSDTVSFSTFSLANVLLATAACNFWFLFWPHDSAPAAWTIPFNPIQTCLLYPSLMQTSFRPCFQISSCCIADWSIRETTSNQVQYCCVLPAPWRSMAEVQTSTVSVETREDV